MAIRRHKRYTGSNREKLQREAQAREEATLTLFADASSRRGMEQRRRLYDDQKGCCAICGFFTPLPMGLDLDHDHATNYIRALLCQRCNQLVGHLERGADLIKHALGYIKLHRSTYGRRLVRLSLSRHKPLHPLRPLVPDLPVSD